VLVRGGGVGLRVLGRTGMLVSPGSVDGVVQSGRAINLSREKESSILRYSSLYRTLNLPVS